MKKKSKAYFPKIRAIQHEGPGSKNPLAFRHYNPDEVIDGKTMSEHLRFGIAYWHTFRGAGVDIFGAGTINRAWESGGSPVDMVRQTQLIWKLKKLEAGTTA